MKITSKNNLYNKFKKLVFVLILFALFFGFNKTIAADPVKEAYFQDGPSIDSFFKIRTTYKKGFRKATAEEWAARGNKGRVLSTDDSPYPIYVWDLDTDWVYGSEADIIYLNPDSSNMLSMTNFNSIDLSGVDTSKVTNMSKMFAFSAYVRTLDISNFNTSNVTDMSSMFEDFGVQNLDLRNFNTSKVTNMSKMFKNQYSYLKSVDLSSFDTSKVTDMSYMFMSDDSVTSLNLSNFYTPEVTNMSHMFDGMRDLESLDISNFNTSKVTDMSYMFSGIKKLKTLDIRHFNTSNVTDMHGMFSGMSDLESLDVSNFNTSKVTDMSYMFKEMDGITSLDLGSFDTSKVTNMRNMFQGSNYLRSINVSSFDTRNVTDMQYMFELCNDLRTIDVSSFKVYNVENMDRMFSYTYNLESIDLSSFDISKVTNMSHMFYTSAVREIDFGSFDTRQVTNMEYIFGGSSLRTVYVSELFNTDNIPDDQVLFFSTESLVGQNGTAYNAANKTKEYAIIDDPDNGHPGYLTYTEYRPKIYYPDGTVEEVRLYDTFTMPEEYPLNSLPLATVTLNPNYDGADSKYSYVENQFVFNKWIVKDTEYDPGDTLVVTYDIYLEPDYVEVTNGADLSPAYRENHKFEGWYTDPEGGELVESYDIEEDITLYAHWSDAQTIPVTMPEEVVYVPYGEDFNLGINDTYRFYGEAEYVNFEYNTGDGGDPSSWIMVIYLVGDGWTIDGVHYDDNSYITVTEPITVNYNNREYKPPIEMPKNPQNGNKYFAGWYMFGNFEGEPYTDDYYYGGGDVTFVAKWIDDPVNLTIDGNTKVVERGYEYTVPSGIINDNNNVIHINLDYSDWNEVIVKTVTIGYGKGIEYQSINGTRYNTGDTYIVNEDTTIVSRATDEDKVVMSPYVTDPEDRIDENDGTVYKFIGWHMMYWDYIDPSDINVDIYSLTPEDTGIDGQTLYADFSSYDSETQTIINYKDEYKKKNFTKIVDKGYEFSLDDISEDNQIDFQINDTIEWTRNRGQITVNALVDHYEINGNDYDPDGSTYTVNDETNIEVIRVISTSRNCGGVYCDLIDEPYPSRISNSNNTAEYIYMGMFTDPDGQGEPIDFSKYGKSNPFYEGSQSIFGYFYFLDDSYVILSVDDEVSVIEKGMGTIPDAKVFDDEVIPITFNYNDGETPNEIRNITTTYDFQGYRLRWNVYEPGTPYDYQEDTYFTSEYYYDTDYPDLIEIDDDHFKGWYTDPVDGDRVWSMSDMDYYYNDYGISTLYAHWGEPTVEICHGKGDCEEIVKGTTVTLEQPEPTVITAHFTLDYNTEEPGYDPKNVTTTRTETVEYYMINGERYDFGETYTFNENVDMYGVTTYTYTSDFVGYYNDNWDHGLNINGYELRGWCATRDGRYCRHYDEDDDIVQPDGLTLYATYYSSEGDTVRVTVDWNWDASYEWPKGESILIPDDVAENIEFAEPQSYYRDIDFDLNDGSGDTLSGRIAVNEVFSHFRVGNDDVKKYQQHDLYTFYRDIHIQSQFTEEFGEIEYPQIDEPTFKGWYTKPEGGRKINSTEDFVKYMDLYNSFTLYAQYYEGLPEDLDIDVDNINMVVGDVHQIDVTFTPDGSGDTLTFTGYDDTKISVVDGLVTALASGETTITVGTENTNISKTITVTIIDNKLESSVYDVREASENKDRVIVGAEPLTTIGDFKDNLSNPNQYIKIYDSEDNELDDDADVRTGLIVKLVYGNNTVDEAILVVRGDTDGDGIVNLSDYMAVINHYVESEEITDYPSFLAADVEEDDILDMSDAIKLMNYYAEIIDTLND